MLRQFLGDEAGFIVSAELVLVGTILVIGLIVGMSQVQHAIVSELADVGHAIGSLNQSFFFTGFSAVAPDHGPKAITRGGIFEDHVDVCDTTCADLACEFPVPECTLF